MARRKNYEVKLTEPERIELEKLVKKGHHSARVIGRAQMLLWMDGGKSDKEITELITVSPATVSNTRKKWVMEKSVEDKPRTGRARLLDGKQEAYLVALTCSDAPEGRETWTMQLLADRLLKLEVIDEAVSDETVRRILQKKS